MARTGTEPSAETGRALVPLEGQSPREDDSRARRIGGRPMATFLTQLMIDSEPGLRRSRAERTSTAASLYRAQAARRG